MTNDVRSEVTRDHSVVHPLVSVVIPFYRQEAYLAETVASVRESGYPNVEVIVVDDGSPTPAASVLDLREDVVIIRTENKGLSAARNRGFQSSSGHYLLFLDSDDRLVSGAIQSHLTTLAENPGAALSFGAVTIIDERGKEIHPSHICRPRKDYFLMLLEGNPVATPGAALIRRSAFLEVGMFDESFRMAEDYRMYLQLARRHPLALNTACVLDRRIHASNMSKDMEPMLAATMAALDRVESETTLTNGERRRLAHGRRRWTHAYRPKNTMSYRLRSCYFSLRAMLSVSPFQYLPSRINMRKEYP